MLSSFAAGALAAILALPLSAAAQTAPARAQETPSLEIRRSERESTSRRPVVKPQQDGDVREAERAAAEYERAQREQSMIREKMRRSPNRPDLGYDVSSSVQQRAIQRLPIR